MKGRTSSVAQVHKMELIGVFSGLIVLISCLHFQNRPSRSSSNGLLVLFASVLYFSQWLIVFSGSAWLIRHNRIPPDISLVTGVIIGFIIGVIDGVYCVRTEAKTPEEQIGGGCLGLLCFVFSLLCGGVFGAFFN